MTMRQGHLSDDRLLNLCIDRRPMDVEAQHLAGCPVCTERRARLARFLTDVSDVIAAQSDAVFTVERLATQRARILQRIEHEVRHARVITFPAAHPHPSSLRGRPGMRWIAGAAAAGLLIGVMAGHLAHQLPHTTVVPASPATVAEVPVEAPQFVAVSLSEEELLGEMEMAVEGTGGSALGPLDDLTPRVWDVAAP